MRLRQGVLLLLMGLLLSACNLGDTATPTEELIVTNTPESSGKPSVTISHRIQAILTKRAIRYSSRWKPPMPQALRAFRCLPTGKSSKMYRRNPWRESVSLMLCWITHRAQRVRVTLRVLAFRGALASDPAEITVNVGSETQPTATSGGSSGNGSGSGPTIPNDGVCRVLTDVSINFRADPTTTRENIITVLPGGTLVPVIGRLGDNSWWQINYNGRVGWLSG